MTWAFRQAGGRIRLRGLPHSKEHCMKFRSIAAVVATTAGALGLAGTALAASGSPASHATTAAMSAAAAPARAAAAPDPINGCVTGTNRTLEQVFTDPANFPGCKSPAFQVTWNVQGPAGPKGATGAGGPQGPQGPAGPAGTSAVTTISASTNVTNWAESSGWATDAFGRMLTETVQHAAPSADCGGTPQCWFVTGQLSDNGTFQTTAGAASPNGSSSAKIAGVLAGTMQGTADFEFYSSTNAITASSVPVSMTGPAKTATTTTWGELAFPKGTTFAGVQLTAYSWTYAAPTTCEQWVDAVNPGDDGQGAADGNIAGVNACSK